MDPDPAIFVIDLQDANKKQTFKEKIFYLLLNIISKDEMSKRSRKTEGIRVFLNIFELWKDPEPDLYKVHALSRLFRIRHPHGSASRGLFRTRMTRQDGSGSRRNNF